MAIFNGTANSETLTRTLAANIVAGLDGNDRQFGDDGPSLIDGGDGHDKIDGGFGNIVLICGAGNNEDNEGEVAGPRANCQVPLFNVFRPF